MTPSANWRLTGEPDPHAGRYEGDRDSLAMGSLTDDELANGAFMNYDQPLNIQGILAGTHSSPIAWMTAVKDRIRWLSRKYEEALSLLDEAEVELNSLAGMMEPYYSQCGGADAAEELLSRIGKVRPAEYVPPPPPPICCDLCTGGRANRRFTDEAALNHHKRAVHQ